MMTLFTYCLLGLVLSAIYAFKPSKLTNAPLLLFFLILLLWSVGVFDAINTAPLVWSKYLNIQFSAQVDGLSRLFVALVTGIGILIILYANIYTVRSPSKRGKLISLLFVFAISMLVIVLSDDMIVLFLGWEATSVTSYLLIQMNPRDSEANQLAFNALFISVLGGLIMLAGFILLQGDSGSWSIQKTLASVTPSLPYFDLAMACLVLGAVTKSAQFPFHFWLPGAMKAPTPVSGYLHSATMVNAGIYLLARFHPLCVQLPYWYPMMAFFGLSTMVISSLLSLYQQDLKALLAYTTLFILGSMTYLLGSNEPKAIEALLLLIFFHALYKAAAFMMVGTIDLEYGTRNVRHLAGIARSNWVLAFVTIVVIGSMAGLPPFFGFVVKQMMFEAKLAGVTSMLFMGLSIFSSMLIAAASFKIIFYFFQSPEQVHEHRPIPFGLSCSLLLALIIVLINLFEPVIKQAVVTASLAIIPSRILDFETTQSLDSVLLSLITVTGGVLFYWLYRVTRDWKFSALRWLNARSAFEKILKAVLYFGHLLTHYTQHNTLTNQLRIIFTTLALVLIVQDPTSFIKTIPLIFQDFDWRVWILMTPMLCSLMLILFNDFFINIILLAVTGLFFALFFISAGGPDVAMTQLLIEILTVIILVIALRKRTMNVHSLDIKSSLINLMIATVVSLAVLGAFVLGTQGRFDHTLSEYFIANSYTKAFGLNVVNVILVDFRALDTLGEVLVIAGTAIAIWLLTRRPQPRVQ